MSATHEVVVTTGGAAAIRDREVGEVMHPIVGPLVESEQLYIDPSRLEERLRAPTEEPLVVFDVGLGAGSNAVAAVRVSEARTSPVRRLEVVSFDRTTGALELALADEHARAFGLHERFGTAARSLLETGRYESGATTWSLVIGELPASLTQGHAEADIVFWDPFSPRANPELWSVRAFCALRRVCGSRAVVHTYSGATSTRSALLLAGFAVGVGEPCAAKSETTVAAADASDLERPLGHRWLERLARSSAPFPRDAPADPLEKIRRAPQFRA